MRLFGTLVAGLLLWTCDSQAGSVGPPTLSALVHESDLVVRGRIVSSQSVKEEIQINERGDRGRFIFTYIEIQPSETLVGTHRGPVVVRLLGGFWGDRAMVDVDAPDLRIDEDMVVFLRQSGRRGRHADEVVYNITGDRFGKFSVDGAGRASRPVRNASLAIAGADPEARSLHISALQRAIAEELKAGPQPCAGCDN